MISAGNNISSKSLITTWHGDIQLKYHTVLMEAHDTVVTMLQCQILSHIIKITRDSLKNPCKQVVFPDTELSFALEKYSYV